MQRIFSTGFQTQETTPYKPNSILPFQGTLHKEYHTFVSYTRGIRVTT